MMDGARGPSRIVTALRVFSAADINIVFGSHGREAAMPSDRASAIRSEVHVVAPG
jgi:hypothetical protein